MNPLFYYLFGIPFCLFLLYLTSRMISAAYFKSQLEFLKNKLHLEKSKENN